MKNSRVAALLAIVLAILAVATPAAAQEAPRSGADCSVTSVGSVPLVDLGDGDYQGENGGLYPDGSALPPADHAALGLWHASQIEPRDAAGNPDPNGTIVLLSIGVSNTRSEFGMFIRRAGDAVSGDVTLINGSQPGEDIAKWQDIEGFTWRNVDGALAQNGVTPEQVQAAWIKLPDIVQSVDAIEPFPSNALTYRDQLEVVVQNANDLYPNLQVAYLSSRIYAGYNTSGRPSPEPLAYENGFGVKWLIEDQIGGDLALNSDPRRGEVESPWLAWGPYLWADGTTPRSDGLLWECGDLQDDGIHPSQSGAVKVADMLTNHFTTDPTAAPWFSTSGEPIGQVEPPPPAGVAETTTTTTTTTEVPDETTTTTSTTVVESQRPGPPDREAREAEREARLAEEAERGSDIGVLVTTAGALALILLQEVEMLLTFLLLL